MPAKAKYPHVEAANQYARDVFSGKIPAGKYIKLACKRHLDDLKKEKKKDFLFRFDPAKGERICQFAELMVHVKGKWAGQQIKLEPWQSFCLAVAFGWLRKSDGLRRFREIYWEIPRKNSKSTLGAIIGNFMLTAEGEPGAEVYSGATSEKQAMEVFRPAWLMAQKSKGFKEHYGLDVGGTHKHPRSIHCLPTDSRFEPLVGNPGEGASPQCAIIDEYHEHKTSDLYDTMTTGMGSRTQPMTVIITTAGTDLAGPCKAKHDYAVKVLEGTLENDELFCIIYGIDKDDDWTDFEVWKKANPNFGVSVFEDYLRAQHRTAMQVAREQNNMRCKHLNQWLSVNTAWMNILEWNACKSEIDLSDFEGELCWIGLDLASKTDLAALMLLFFRDPDFYAFGRYYLPEETIYRPENQHYQTWKLMERITETPGPVTDYAYIKDDLREFASLFEIRRVGYDPFQATQLSTEMAVEGFTMVEVRPNVLHFSEPMKEIEKLVLQRKFHHDGDPVLTWAMSNVVAHYDKKDNIYPNKERPENKIDPVVALIIAKHLFLASPEREIIDQGFIDLEKV